MYIDNLIGKRRTEATTDGQIAALAVAEKGSFEAAGKYRHRKSAVRKRVRSVESELGASVVLAVGKEIVPADAGNIYLPVARALGMRSPARFVALPSRCQSHRVVRRCWQLSEGHVI
jgi:hypothetical protein